MSRMNRVRHIRDIINGFFHSREVENNRWEPPQINPVDTTFLNKPFYENLNTRILEKDYFKVKYSRGSIVNGDPIPYNK